MSHDIACAAFLRAFDYIQSIRNETATCKLVWQQLERRRAEFGPTFVFSMIAIAKLAGVHEDQVRIAAGRLRDTKRIAYERLGRAGTRFTMLWEIPTDRGDSGTGIPADRRDNGSVIPIDHWDKGDDIPTDRGDIGPADIPTDPWDKPDIPVIRGDNGAKSPQIDGINGPSRVDTVLPSTSQEEERETVSTYLHHHVQEADPCKAAVVAWNAMAEETGLAKVRSLTKSRRQHLRSRLDEHGLGGVLEAIGKIAASPFCHGDGSRGWKADFDFLLQPKSMSRALEGFYDRRCARAQNDDDAQKRALREAVQAAREARLRREQMEHAA